MAEIGFGVVVDVAGLGFGDCLPVNWFVFVFTVEVTASF